MDWFKTSSSFWSHPKVTDLKDRPFRVLVSSWGYAAQHGTDGHISEGALRLIGGRPGDAKALEEAGLWHRNGTGWHIHDWDDHQEKAVQIEEKKRRDKERKQAARREAQQ